MNFSIKYYTSGLDLKAEINVIYEDLTGSSEFNTIPKQFE